MAQAPKQSGGDGDANFVRQIVADPKNVPDVMLLNGYLGASSEEGHERLYLCPDLSSYVEIPGAAILHRAPVPLDQDPNGAVTLWVKKDAALHYKMSPAAQALANYFAGAIAAAQGAAGAGFGQAGMIQPTPPVTLLPGFSCGIDCTVFGPLCQTRRTPCLLTQPTPCAGASCGIDCTVIGPACQSIRVGTCVPECFVTRFPPQCPHTWLCTHVAGGCQTHPPGICPLPAGAGAQAGIVHQPTHNITPCRPTLFQPQCPYPSEICSVHCHTLAPPLCPVPFDAAAAGAAPQAAFAGQANVAWTHVTPCFPTAHRTCAMDCTAGCPYPTEVTCVPGCRHTAACTPNVSFACFQQEQAAEAAFAGQANVVRSVVDCTIVCPTLIRPCLSYAPCITQYPVQCSFVCPTRYWTCNPGCYITRHVTCNPGCQITNQVVCPIATGVACPQVSLDCPQQSLACGGSLGCGGGFPGQQGFGGPVAQAQAFNPGGGANVAGSYAPHCWYSWNACPTEYGCGPHHSLGCPQ